MNELVEAQEKYIRLLGEELEEIVYLAHSHGWRSTRYDEWVKLREEIAMIKSLLGEGKNRK